MEPKKQCHFGHFSCQKWQFACLYWPFWVPKQAVLMPLTAQQVYRGVSLRQPWCVAPVSCDTP